MPPSHIRDMEQSIDATQINKCTEVRNVLDDTLSDLTNFQFLHQVYDLLRVGVQ